MSCFHLFISSRLLFSVLLRKNVNKKQVSEDSEKMEDAFNNK